MTSGVQKMPVNLNDSLARLESLGNEKVCARNTMNDAGDNQFDDNPWAARAGWSLTSERIATNPEGLDLD
jgi:hypothetical protein